MDSSARQWTPNLSSDFDATDDGVSTPTTSRPVSPLPWSVYDDNYISGASDEGSDDEGTLLYRNEPPSESEEVPPTPTPSSTRISYPTVDSIYAGGDVILEVAFIQSCKQSRQLLEDGRSVSWADIQRFAVTPGYRARVSSVVLSVASDILRETFQLLSTQMPGKWFRPLNHTQRTRGIYWYRVDSNAVVQEINLVCVSDFHQFLWPEWKSLLPESFKSLMCILHHKSPAHLDSLLAVDLEEGTERGLVYLSILSELAWVFGCEGAIESTIQLARISLQARVSEYHDDARNINTPLSPELPELRKNKYGFYPGDLHYLPGFSLSPHIKLAFVWNDRIAFQKATQLYILGTGGVPRVYEYDNMGILPLMLNALQERRDSIIDMCFNVLNQIYITLSKWKSFRSPEQERSCCLYLGKFIRALGNCIWGSFFEEPLTFPLSRNFPQHLYWSSPSTLERSLRGLALEMEQMESSIGFSEQWVRIQLNVSTSQASASLEFVHGGPTQGCETLPYALTTKLDSIFERGGLDLVKFRC